MYIYIVSMYMYVYIYVFDVDKLYRTFIYIYTCVYVLTSPYLLWKMSLSRYCVMYYGSIGQIINHITIFDK